MNPATFPDRKIADLADIGELFLLGMAALELDAEREPA